MLAAIFKRWETHLSQRDTNRRVRPFEWGLEFTINGGKSRGDCPLQAVDSREPLSDPRSHSGDARSALIDFADRALADSDSYHAYEPVRDYRLDGNHLTFTSPVHTIYPKNNTVHGWYFPAESRDRVVLVLPQWNCDARGHMSLCSIMRHFGLSSMRLSLPHMISGCRKSWNELEGILLMQRICDCHWFKKNIKEIEIFITLGWTHGMIYHGALFEYCPWCGKRLQAK